jgi:hypothetical protein
MGAIHEPSQKQPAKVEPVPHEVYGALDLLERYIRTHGVVPPLTLDLLLELRRVITASDTRSDKASS